MAVDDLIASAVLAHDVYDTASEKRPFMKGPSAMFPLLAVGGGIAALVILALKGDGDSSKKVSDIVKTKKPPEPGSEADVYQRVATIQSDGSLVVAGKKIAARDLAKHAAKVHGLMVVNVASDVIPAIWHATLVLITRSLSILAQNAEGFAKFEAGADPVALLTFVGKGKAGAA